ncbi:hypothetical protein [Hymenobacter sp. IS2118]|uniref:hypothetical protein n=1 Tax=Hymenobacter sp. IS2118 TaxID=1505605 RepID=UPI000555B282|nr:hypothetical protein [Hymenobacter sp. IS2118]
MSQNSIFFDYNTYPLQLEKIGKINIPDFQADDKGKDAWQYHGNKDSKYNQVVEFELQDQVDDSDNPLNYRAWYMETSVAGANAGLLVSAKLDYIRGGEQDFHLTLLCGFDGAGKLLMAQASAQFEGGGASNFHIPPITLAQTPDGDIGGALRTAIETTVKGHDYGDKRDNAGAKGFGYVAQANVLSFVTSVQTNG